MARTARRKAKRTSRDMVRYIDLPPELATNEVTRIEVRRYATPIPFSRDGFGEMKRGVYCSTRSGTYAGYAVIDSQRRQIGVLSDVPLQPSGWSTWTDRGEIHEAVRDEVLYEGWRMLLHRDPVPIPEEEAQLPSTRALFCGLIPYTPERTADGDGARRIIEVYRGEEHVTVRLERDLKVRDYIELGIGGDYRPTRPNSLDVRRGIGRSEGSDGPAWFVVSDMRALEQLHEALGSAITRAREDRWPFEADVG